MTEAGDRNEQLVRRFVDAFNRRDFDSVIDELGPAVELHEWPAAPGARTYTGHDGVRAALDSWFEAWEWMQIEIEGIEELDGRVLATLHQRAQGKGSAVDVEITTWNVWEFDGGKATRIQLFTERDAALAAAGTEAKLEEEEEERT